MPSAGFYRMCSGTANLQSRIRSVTDCWIARTTRRPEVLDGEAVPSVLLSGDHGAIRHWRRVQALGRTWQRRPDLLPNELSEEDNRLLDEYRAGIKAD